MILHRQVIDGTSWFLARLCVLHVGEGHIRSRRTSLSRPDVYKLRRATYSLSNLGHSDTAMEVPRDLRDAVETAGWRFAADPSSDGLLERVRHPLSVHQTTTRGANIAAGDEYTSTAARTATGMISTAP